MSNDAGARPRARMAEARRNRVALLQVAQRAFAQATGPVSFEAIAREAGVGIGTLYRHFPTREALVEAVYEHEIERLRTDATRLLMTSEPAVALRTWMHSFAAWAITKHAMTDTLAGIIASGRLDPGAMRVQLIEIVQQLLDAGHEARDLRSDVTASDIAALLAGVLAGSGGTGDRQQTQRLLDLVADGLRPDPTAQQTPTGVDRAGSR
ncbi:TetR/AcrR family transcriptional regulator [Amnibacterium kyonggiense]